MRHCTFEVTLLRMQCPMLTPQLHLRTCLLCVVGFGYCANTRCFTYLLSKNWNISTCIFTSKWKIRSPMTLCPCTSPTARHLLSSQVTGTLLRPWSAMGIVMYKSNAARVKVPKIEQADHAKIPDARSSCQWLAYALRSHQWKDRIHGHDDEGNETAQLLRVRQSVLHHAFCSARTCLEAIEVLHR